MLISSAASRSAMPVEAAPEVTIPTTKMAGRTGAADRDRRGRSWAFENALICLKRKIIRLKMPLPPPWSRLADDKTSTKRA